MCIKIITRILSTMSHLYLCIVLNVRIVNITVFRYMLFFTNACVLYLYCIFTIRQYELYVQYDTLFIIYVLVCVPKPSPTYVYHKFVYNTFA